MFREGVRRWGCAFTYVPRGQHAQRCGRYVEVTTSSYYKPFDSLSGRNDQSSPPHASLRTSPSLGVVEFSQERALLTGLSS